jgi:urea transport system substrate-binding protein
MIVGTPSYMCPEQAYGAPLDARSDLFSLGCLLYAMLAGESPFLRANTIQSIRAVAEEDAPPIHHRMPHLHGQIAALVHRLVSKQPKDRPGSATKVIDEIRLLEMLVQPTIGLPAGMPTALGTEPARSRSKLGWGSWAGIAAVVTAAIVGISVQFFHLAKQRGAAHGDHKVAASDSNKEHGSRQAAIPPLLADLPPIKVGILHSFSGPMATSESPIADAFLFAIDEINDAGGVLGGRKIQPVVRDGKSYPDVFAEQAEKLIADEHVATLFGVWRSGSRKSVEEVCRKHNQLLVYPRADEGLEQSPHVIYMGGAPNQQTTPAVKWAYAFLGKRKFFLVGTEGLFSCGSHEIIKDELAALGASVVGEELVQVGVADFNPLVAKVKQSDADVILNTVSGAGNIALFNALHEAGIKADTLPVISYDVTEEELRRLMERGEDLAGNYAAWTYFQSLDNPVNRLFIEKFRRRFGDRRPINDPMAAAYAGMHMWARAVDAANSDKVEDIRRAMVKQKFEAPEGLVTIDPVSQRAVRMARVGQILPELEFEVVWTSPKPIFPVALPSTRTRAQWEAYIESLYVSWGSHWAPQRNATKPTTTPDKASQP